MYESSIREEHHPLIPFLPPNARLLMLGSFPPPQKRWSMQFYYPNFTNDMWRIMGLIFYADKQQFVTDNKNSFDKQKIIRFLTTNGIALYDAATTVKRLANNASDQFLQVITPTDIAALIRRLPYCTTIAATGQKAARIICNTLQLPLPCPNKPVTFTTLDCRTLSLHIMPSTSRAYPMSLPNKADAYRRMLQQAGISTPNPQ